MHYQSKCAHHETNQQSSHVDFNASDVNESKDACVYD